MSVANKLPLFFSLQTWQIFHQPLSAPIRSGLPLCLLFMISQSELSFFFFWFLSRGWSKPFLNVCRFFIMTHTFCASNYNSKPLFETRLKWLSEILRDWRDLPWYMCTSWWNLFKSTVWIKSNIKKIMTYGTTKSFTLYMRLKC